MKRLGNYVLVGKVSSGGMAEVYRARMVGIRGFSRAVAIKRIFPHLLERERFLRMFTDEAKIASRLKHPNIVQILELGEDRGVPYIAMEYVPGRDLFLVVQRLARRRQRFPIGLARRVVAEVCNALDHAHDFGGPDGAPQEIIHRDVSPRNILIGFDGEVKLTDFGVARARDREEHTEHGLIKGKIRYLSPEAAAGRELDRRSDVFSLGVVLAECLLMAPLYPEANDLALLSVIREGRLDLTRLVDFPIGLRPVLDRALAVDRERRFVSAREFMEAVNDPAIEGEPPWSAERTGQLMRDLFAEEIERERRRELEVDSLLAAEARGELPAPAGDRRPGSAAPAVPVPRLPTPAPSVPPRFAYPKRAEAEETPALEGNLAVDSLARGLHRLAVEHATGRLDVRREPLVKSLFLELGEPVFVTSNSSTELLGEYLVVRGRITAREHVTAMDLAASKGLRFTEALLQLEILAPHQLYRFLAEQVRERMVEVFTWSTGRYAFYPGVEPPELGIPLDLRTHELVREGVMDRLPMATVRRSLEGQVRRPVQLAPTGPPEHLRLSGREQRLLRALQSEPRSIADLVRSERDEEMVMRLVYLLREVGCLAFGESEDAA